MQFYGIYLIVAQLRSARKACARFINFWHKLSENTVRNDTLKAEVTFLAFQQ